jgi:hypothetical protein
MVGCSLMKWAACPGSVVRGGLVCKPVREAGLRSAVPELVGGEGRMLRDRDKSGHCLAGGCSSRVVQIC